MSICKQSVNFQLFCRSIYIFNCILFKGINAPAIIGVDWRLDYSIRSKNAGRENVPLFFVSLKVKDRGLIRDVNMIATLEELQDMLSKVHCFCNLSMILFTVW